MGKDRSRRSTGSGPPRHCLSSLVDHVQNLHRRSVRHLHVLTPSLDSGPGASRQGGEHNAKEIYSKISKLTRISFVNTSAFPRGRHREYARQSLSSRDKCSNLEEDGVVADTAKQAVKRRREKKQRKRIEDAVVYALSHKIRFDILILLNEASYRAAEIAELINIPVPNVANHVRRMLEDGTIEIAKEEVRRGTNVYWYRAVELPYYSKEEAEALTWMERQVTAGLVVQSGLAEVMAALFKGVLADIRTILSWDWYNVDKQGEDDLEAENLRHLDRIREIECESINRVAESGEETKPILVSLFAFVRARKPRRPRLRLEPKSAN